MKKLLILVLIFSANFSFAQTHTRKMINDKAKGHSHTTKYYIKKVLTLKPSETKKKK